MADDASPPSDPATLFQGWREHALRRESHRATLPFGVFALLDARHQGELIDTLFDWAYGPDADALNARYLSAADTSNGAEVFHERVPFSELAANALFGLSMERPASRALLETHLPSLERLAEGHCSARRILAGLERESAAGLRPALDSDSTRVGRVLTAAALAHASGRHDIAEVITGLLAILPEVRVAALRSGCERSEVSAASWEPFYGPLRTWAAELSVALPSVQRPAAESFAQAIVRVVVDGEQARDVLTTAPDHDESGVTRFADSLPRKDQPLDVSAWDEMSPWARRWARAQTFRRLLRTPPQERALDALLVMTPATDPIFAELAAHLEWMEQYSEVPSAVLGRLRAEL